MAKPKLDFKQLLMDKGEKITILAAGVLMVMFLTLGILAVATSASTSENEHSILNKVEDINRKMSSNEEKIDNLDESLMKQLEFPSVSASQFRGTNMFVDIALDNAKRGRPTVLQPDEFQVDLIRAPIYVYHFSSDRSKIYVLKEITKAGPKSVTDLKDRAKTGGAKKPAGGAPAPGPAGVPGGPGGVLPGGRMPARP